ncbi:hypothetical protein [Bradyrhizobium sp. AZCC 1719]|uniref:hypothetical protein n=1 Tax=Bradyrhizobium sp. AZCC 1719 TaxID=3117028 RepID=UPI002FF326BE
MLNYIDSNGNHYALEARPERKFDRNAQKLAAFLREELLSSGENNSDSPFRRLRAESRKVESKQRHQWTTMIAEGGNLRSAWVKMVRFGDEVNSTGYEYRPYSQNSNSFAAAALKRAGFFGPGTAFPEFFDRLLAVDSVGGQAHPVFVPGFDQRLTNPLNKSATMRTPVQELEIPLVPTNGNPQHRRQNLFNGRFGIWAAPPSGSLNQAAPSLLTGRPASMGDKPVRYLSRRIAGKAEASVFDTGTPPVPFVPTKDLLSPDTNVSFGDRFGARASSAYGHGSARDAFPPTMPGGLAGIDPAKPIGTPQTSDGATSSEVDGNRRFLTRRIAGQPRASVFDTGAPPVPFVPTNDFLSPDTTASFGDRFGGRALSGFNGLLGKPASDPLSPDTPDGLAGRIAALAGIYPANPDPRVLPQHENGSYNGGLLQPWLFRALTGRL